MLSVNKSCLFLQATDDSDMNDCSAVADGPFLLLIRQDNVTNVK